MDTAALLDALSPLPDGVRFFASTLTFLAKEPGDTGAYGARRHGLFLAPDALVLHVKIPTRRHPVPGPLSPAPERTLVVSRADVRSIERLEERALALAWVEDGRVRRCEVLLDAVALFPDQVMGEVESWLRPVAERGERLAGNRA